MRIRKVSIFEILVCIYYTWFFLPICNAYFSAGIYKYIFFLMFIIGIVGLAAKRARLFVVKFNAYMFAIVIYMITMAMLYLLGVGDANLHIRVSFTFWGTALLYNIIQDEDTRIRIGKYLLNLFLVTCITSAVGVFIDNSAARTIAYAASDELLQKSFKMKNIANIYLFQGMVIMVPVIIALKRFACENLRNTKLIKAICFILIVGIGIVLLNASFTISLLVFAFSVYLSLMVTRESSKTRVIVSFFITLLVIILLCAGDPIITFFAGVIDNAKVAVRLIELRDLVYRTGRVTGGDVGLRIDLYSISWNTFKNNLFGIGPFYSYVKFDKGIGYHSQLLDDLARYGVFAICFYALLIKGMYAHLKEQWGKLNQDYVAKIIITLYIVFLFFNLGFRSSEESILMLYIIPIIPDIVISRFGESFDPYDIER